MCDICDHYFCRFDVAKYHIKNQHPMIEETTRSAYITAKATETFNPKQYAKIPTPKKPFEATTNRCKTKINFGPKPKTSMDIQNPDPNFITIKTLETDLPTLTSRTNKNLITIKTLEPVTNIYDDLFISSDSNSSIEDKTNSRGSTPCFDEHSIINNGNPEIEPVQNESKTTGSLQHRLATAGITHL